MVPNMFASIFYAVTFVILLFGTIVAKKTEKKLNILLWISVAFMAICGLQTFVAAILGLVKIPINIITLGIVNGVVGGALWINICKKQEKQSYFLEKTNVVGFGVLALLLLLFILRTCGVELAPHYLAVDAAAHFRMAMGMVNSEGIYGMYFAALHHGIFIELFGPFISSAVYYKLFVLSDMLHLLFSWIMFYCLIQKYAKDRFLKFTAIIVSVVYALGYPANSTLFGFTYLGMGITVIAYLLIVFDWFESDDFDERYSIPLLSLGCLSIFESYVLFMPVVFFAILFAMFYKQLQKKKLISGETIKYGLSIFLMPTIIGLLYTYMGTFNETTETTVSSAIANEGGIYRDLFSNFVILVPFVLFAFVILVKEKKNKLVMWLLPLLLVFMFALLVLGVNGKVSSYYYYKNYYVLWLLAFEMFFIAIAYFGKEIRLFLSFGFLTWLAVLVGFIINVETAIYNKAPMFVSSLKAGAYNDIYGFNRDASSLPRYSGEKLELYQFVSEEIRKEDELVAIASEWEDWYWMEVITNQTMDVGFYHWAVGTEIYFETLERDADYVVVLYDSTIYQNNSDKFAGYETVFSNAVGAILKIR